MKLFLTCLICSLKSFTLTQLGTGTYENLAHCYFEAPYVVDIDINYQYTDTIFSYYYQAKLVLNMGVYIDLYYNDTSTYKYVLKSTHFSPVSYYYYYPTDGTWVSCELFGNTNINLYSGDDFESENFYNLENIVFLPSVVQEDSGDIFIQVYSYYSTGGVLSSTGITNNDDSIGVSSAYPSLGSMIFNSIHTHNESYSIYEGFDSGFLRDALRDLVSSTGGFNEGYSNGFNDGKIVGYTDGYNVGSENGYNTGKNDGYALGLADGAQTDEIANSIYAGILAIGFIPVQFFLSIFNFEIFGINITGFVTSLMSVCITLIIIKRTFAIHED